MNKTTDHAWQPFSRPQPRSDCLSNVAVLLQAWKKTVAFLRTKSWIADTLTLDVSHYSLNSLLEKLQYRLGTLDDCTPRPQRLVLAPKSDVHKWEISNDAWHPSPKRFTLLRPLAHLELEDQILATAFLITLADHVETTLGRCDVHWSTAQKHSVCAYGNRLFCNWKTRSDGQEFAEFAWGNATLYRKHSVDYQAFLRRPYEVCKNYAKITSATSGLFVVSMDLKNFYDRIPPQALVEALKQITCSQGVIGEGSFWNRLGSSILWNWEDSDQKLAKFVESPRLGKSSNIRLPTGLPQGLVAAGFFSNAYMHHFDSAIQEALRPDWESTPSANVQLIDYCRFVDDIRLVVACPFTSPPSDVAQNVVAKVTDIVMREIPDQELNGTKTSIKSWGQLRESGQKPILMAAISEKNSAPLDRESISELNMALDGLVELAKSHTDEESATGNIDLIQTADDTVRDDTVKRFVANRKVRLLRKKKQLGNFESTVMGSLHGKAIDTEIEHATRWMLTEWARDPSLVLLLRHAFELFPSSKLLNPVLSALERATKLSDEPLWGVQILKHNGKLPINYPLANKVAHYVLSELFRSFSDEIRSGRNAAFTDAMERREFYELLAEAACRCLNNQATPWYTGESAIIYLLTLDHDLTSTIACSISEQYKLLVSLAKGGPLKQQMMPLLLVLDLLHGDHTRTARRLLVHCRELSKNSIRELLHFVHTNAQHLLSEIHRLATSRNDAAVIAVLREFWDIASTPRHISRGWHSFAEAVRSANNPFKQELSVLRFADVLVGQVLDSALDLSDLHPVGIRVKGKWETSSEDASREIQRTGATNVDSRFEIPAWLPSERQLPYAIGRLIQSAFYGRIDYTYPHDNRSIRFASSFAERQVGIASRKHISHWDVSCSPWLTGLLMSLLAWPGSQQSQTGMYRCATSVHQLKKEIRKRLRTLTRLYGRSSNLPVYDIDVKAISRSNSISLALVQTVRPTRADLQSHGPELDSPVIRSAHRSHLASILRILYEQAKLRQTYGKNQKIDLVILPEISVHRADVDLVEDFARTTKSIVFLGLSFFRKPEIGIVNSGLWVVPTRRKTGLQLNYFYQGKHHMMKDEEQYDVKPHRPHQYVLRIKRDTHSFNIAGAMCFDATDLRLAADLRDVTDLLIVSANNRDVPTFDTMAQSLSWLMFQHVAIVNTGEFGGSVVQAPYRESFQRTLVHGHGGMQAGISIVDIDLSDYQRMREKPPNALKSPPAGFRRH